MIGADENSKNAHRVNAVLKTRIGQPMRSLTGRFAGRPKQIDVEKTQDRTSPAREETGRDRTARGTPDRSSRKTTPKTQATTKKC